MDFLKKNYEKLLLGLVLTGLIGALVMMLFYISADQDEMQKRSEGMINPASVKALPNLDMTAANGAIARPQLAYHLDFETTNKVFNPQEWQRSLDGSLILAATKTGPQVAVVTNIAPLYLIVSFDSVITNAAVPRYVIGVEMQAAPTRAKRFKFMRYASVGDKPNDIFSLESIQGPPDNPSALVLKWVDSGKKILVARDRAFRQIDAYEAGLWYAPEKKGFAAKRIGDRLSFGGGDYQVIEVNPHELILVDLSNQKKTSLPFTP